MLKKEGLNYGQLPKGMLLFHQYAEGPRTPMEEHLVEGALYAASNGEAHVHFTVSHEHIEFFKANGQKTIVNRLKPLEDVGLGYIKLGQNSSTLSGGENQRVKLAYFIGHTVLIIEHNMDVIKLADHVIDLGPDGGDKGGNLVIAGTPEEVAKCKNSITGQYLKLKI